MNPTKKDVYEVITARIMELLDKGIVPWHRPWRGGRAGKPKNLASGKDYRGVNTFLLHCASLATGYDSPYWLTFNQAKERGGTVRKGEHGMPVVFWNWLERDKIDSQTGQTTTEEIPFLRYYTVFNVEQCDGIDYPKSDTQNTPLDFQPITECEAVVEGFTDKPTIEHDGHGRAFYRPSTDTVHLPDKSRFGSEHTYYATLFHELTHSTGHESRLGRCTDQKQAAFGSTDYGKEELVAEMGAAFLCGDCGIDGQTIANSAAYVDGWRRAIRQDKKLVIHAAAQAQKAADYILKTA
jgi:antirestriction protein ArdC